MKMMNIYAINKCANLIGQMIYLCSYTWYVNRFSVYIIIKLYIRHFKCINVVIILYMEQILCLGILTRMEFVSICGEGTPFIYPYNISKDIWI